MRQYTAMMHLSVRAQEMLLRLGIISLLVAVVGGGLWLVGKAVRQEQREEELRRSFSLAVDALEHLARDTGQHPGHIALTPCIADKEVLLSECEAGLVCSDGKFPAWRGPYLSQAPRDPWGNTLRFDPDYACVPDIAGCEAEGWVRAVVSAGPDATFDTSDDRVVVLCRE